MGSSKNPVFGSFKRLISGVSTPAFIRNLMENARRVPEGLNYK